MPGVPFMPALDSAEDLSIVELFKGLSEGQLAKVASLLHRKTFHPGSNLMMAQQTGEVVYIILSGSVKICLDREDGTEVIIAILGPGDTVGEMSLIDNTNRCANVMTLEDSMLLWMDKGAFQECLRTMQPMSFNLFRILAQRLRLANEQIQALAAMELESRVARQLLAFALRYGKKSPHGEVAIPLRLTQSDLAALVGASRERINQVMVAYRERKYLSVDSRHHVTILNQQALAHRCA